MKIGVTGLRGIPHVMGGIETHCEELYPRLSDLRRGDSFVVIARSPYVPPHPAPYRGVRIVPVFTVRNKYLETILNTFLAIFYIRFRMRGEAVHIHGIGPATMAPLARLLGLKLIVTHHGEDFNRLKWNRFAKTVLILGEWCAVRTAHALIVVSDKLAADLRRRHPTRAGRIGHIPNGASLIPAGGGADWIDATLGALGLVRGEYVLAVGRLVPEKGFHDLIDAFMRSSATGKLVIAGKADHQDVYARALLARAGDRVVFVGFQPHDKLRALYSGASLFVLPSYHEGLPIAALEAAAAGCPMLLSDIAPNGEIGLDPVNYFPVGDVSALAARLGEDHRQFVIRSDEVMARFDWDEIARATSSVYDRVAREDLAR